MKSFGIRPRLAACIALALLAIVVPAGSQQSARERNDESPEDRCVAREL